MGPKNESTGLISGRSSSPVAHVKPRLRTQLKPSLCCPISVLVFGLVVAAVGGIPLAFSLAADPSKDFHVVDGACNVANVSVVRWTLESEKNCDKSGNGCDYSYTCLDDYTYKVCLPGSGDFKTYPAGTSPIELCHACTDSGGKHDCAEGDSTYWPCIASLPCLKDAKWNQHNQLSTATRFECEVAIEGVASRQACEGFGYDKTQCAAVGCCQYVECPIGDGSGECLAAGDGDCIKTEGEMAVTTKQLPSCEEVSSQRRLAELDCFESMKDRVTVCGQSCGSCDNVKTSPTFKVGEERICWAPTPGTTPRFPYSCGNAQCYKVFE